MQKGKSIAFEGKKLSNADKNFGMYNKDMFAIMHALERFKKYLIGDTSIIKSALTRK